VREDELAQFVKLGQDNAGAIDLVRRHCRHARVEMPDGNSPVGSTCNLPMGRLEVRCGFASAPRISGHRALELAVEFYRENCVGCSHRLGTGELPNLATIVAERDAEADKARQCAERATRERAARHAQRRQRRRQLVSGEGYVARELAQWLDRLDADNPRGRALRPEEHDAARHLVETARHAPELFSPPLVQTLLHLAVDTAEPTAFTAIIHLVRGHRCDARAAVRAALAVLPAHRIPEAARLLDAFDDQLRADDLPPVLGRLVQMAAVRHACLSPPQAVPEGLLAAARTDLSAVTTCLIERLGSDDEWTRADAADATAVLLREDPGRVVALGPALVASIRGEDIIYADYPHPASAATRALAEAWRGQPAATVAITERGAQGLTAEGRRELIRTMAFLDDGREPLDVTEAAIGFCLRRLGGDWGEEAARAAATAVEDLAREMPAQLVPHVDALLGELLALCAVPPSTPLTVELASAEAADLAALEALQRRVTRDARRGTIARAIGRLTRYSPERVLDRVLPMFEASSGDPDQDRDIRVALLDVLTDGASAASLRDLLPVVYSGLLGTNQTVRHAAIRLWAACAGVADDAIPDELADLAEVLLTDEYLIVVRTMLDKLPALRLPTRLAPRLLPIVAASAQAYVDEPVILEHALAALRHLAEQLDDEQQALGWQSLALALVDRLHPYDRERMLTWPWPPRLRMHPAWTRAALGAIASPELLDRFHRREDDLLGELLDHPAPLTDVPFDEVAAVTETRLPIGAWRALEPVELLQSVGRWAEAHTIASRVLAAAPAGREGQEHRRLAAFVELATRLAEQASNETDVGIASLADTARTVQDNAAALAEAWALPDDDNDRRAQHFLVTATAPANATLALLTPATNAMHTADILDAAAQHLQTATGERGAPAIQRSRLAQTWEIAAHLFRYDAAVQQADADSSRFLQAAHRRAQRLREQLHGMPAIPAPDALSRFCATVEALASPSEVAAAAAQLAHVMAPVRLIFFRRHSPQPPEATSSETPEDPPYAVCVASLHGAPVTDVLVLRPHEMYQLGMTVRVPNWPDWADMCRVRPVTTLSRAALSLPVYTFTRADAITDDAGMLLTATQPLHCTVEQPIQSPAIDCPLVIEFIGGDRQETISVAGYRRLRLRPFDPSRDRLTEHEQTDARLLAMYDALAGPEFDTEDVRAFCRLFSACVRAAQSIMFHKVFHRGTRITEAMFHDELEQRLRADPELGGRLTRRDAVAGGFDDLLHDDVIAELKVVSNRPVTIDDCTKYLGQPTQYGVGRGSQLSVLVVLDHSPKQAPPGVIDNYVGWLKPRLHGLEDPRYPSLVGVLIINTNLPVPSTWSRRKIATVPWTSTSMAAG